LNFLSELRRRNVIRVAVAYLVAAWLLLQVTDVLSSVLELPPSAAKFVLLLLVIGFVPALLFAWAYQVTPDGLQRDTGGTPPHETAHNLDRATIAMLVVVAGLVLYDRYEPREPESEPSAREQGTKTLSAVESPVSLETKAGKGSKALSEDDQATPESAPSIAVLPFVNMSDEAGNEYFADGLSEELLNLLVKVPELRVAARTSSFSFRDKEMTVAEIARQLHVDHVLEGSVRKAGDRVRITAQLIETREGFHLWSETYDRRLDDIFAVQDEIAAAVVEALKLRLLYRSADHRATQYEVYSLYLQALYEHNKTTPASLKNAVEKLDAALAIDPAYAPALALRASAYLFQAQDGSRPFDAGFEEGRRTILEALRIDPSLTFAWGVMAYIQAYYDWDFAAAELSTERMQLLEPNAAATLNIRSFLAGILGQFDAALEFRERSIQLDPLNHYFQSAYYFMLVGTGEYKRAEALLHNMIEDTPDDPAPRWRLVRLRLIQHDLEGAVELAGTTVPYNRNSTMLKALLHQLSGDAEAAEADLNGLIAGDDTGEGQFFLSEFYAWTGDREAALEHLTRAVDARYRILCYVLNDQFLFPIHDDPRWREQIARIGLLDAWLKVPERYGGPAGK